jgi:NADH dehydrogenase/NADH:ubiquinone oxidoreductase subunit G
MIQITIDNQLIEIAEDRTLLEACRENGIQVPTLCYHPALKPYGACRLCMVELVSEGNDSHLVASCAYPCEEGLVVRTNSEVVKKNRLLTLELLLASAHQTPEIITLAKELGVDKIRYKLPEVDSCILCALCVRACREIVGIEAISLIGRGISKEVSPPFETASSTCIGCGTCVLICPTGRIKLENVYDKKSKHKFSTDYINVLCKLCGDSSAGPQTKQPLAASMEHMSEPSLERSVNSIR